MENQGAAYQTEAEALRDERNQHSGREGREDDEVGGKRAESPHALTLRSRRVWLQINDQATTTNSESNQRKF